MSRRPYYALSIQQPWADAILHRGKDVENRTWAAPRHMIGKRFYIHAGKRIDRDAAQVLGMVTPRDRLGAILGEARLRRCVRVWDSEWFCGPYGFVLEDVVAYDEPIPCRGRLGFFRPDLPLEGP